jgi:ATP-dependent protease HslVU (ClpYQ) ATPase subunit
VIFSDEGLRAIAEKAADENTGARGLLTVCEHVLRDFKFELPSSKVRQFVVTRELVERPRVELQRILREPAYEQRELMRQCVREFERRFDERYNLRIRLADDAVEEIIDRAQQAHKSITELCNELFKDYQFGLNLVKNNSGQTEFVIPKAALADPDKFLSDWVVSSHRDK